MPECCVPGCNGQDVFGTKNLGNVYFPFPLADKNLLKKWLTVLEKENWMPDTTSRVCGQHFFPFDYEICEKSMTARLKPDAIPYVINYQKIKSRYPVIQRQPKVFMYRGNNSEGQVIETVGENNTLKAFSLIGTIRQSIIENDVCIVSKIE